MILVVMGVSGCGKTTVGRLLAEALGCAFDDADDFHPPPNVEKMRRGEPLTDEDRRPWLLALRQRIEHRLAHDQTAVVACSALTQAARQSLGVNNTTVRLVYLKGDFDTLHARIAARKDHFMPASLLRSQFALLQEPKEAIVVNVADTPQACVKNTLENLNNLTQRHRGTEKNPKNCSVENHRNEPRP